MINGPHIYHVAVTLKLSVAISHEATAAFIKLSK